MNREFVAAYLLSLLGEDAVRRNKHTQITDLTIRVIILSNNHVYSYSMHHHDLLDDG